MILQKKDKVTNSIHDTGSILIELIEDEWRFLFAIEDMHISEDLKMLGQCRCADWQSPGQVRDLCQAIVIIEDSFDDLDSGRVCEGFAEEGESVGALGKAVGFGEGHDCWVLGLE